VENEILALSTHTHKGHERAAATVTVAMAAAAPVSSFSHLSRICKKGAPLATAAAARIFAEAA